MSVVGERVLVHEDFTVNISSLQIGINILVKSKAFQYFMCKCEISQLQVPFLLRLTAPKVEMQGINPAVMMLAVYYRKFQACIRVEGL